VGWTRDPIGNLLSSHSRLSGSNVNNSATVADSNPAERQLMSERRDHYFLTLELKKREPQREAALTRAYQLRNFEIEHSWYLQ
jgi:hypothetical protein